MSAHPISNQLVLIEAASKDGNGSTQFLRGTGYFISANLVLTANHVFPSAVCESIRVRLHQIGKWRDADPTLVWQSDKLDAALVYVKEGMENASVVWQEVPFPEQQQWRSIGYPSAHEEMTDDGSISVSSELSGKLYPEGGAGQLDIRKLELTVDAPPTPPEKWRGISGAPVFVGDKLAGILKSIPKNFDSRLWATPVFEILKDAGFIAAISRVKYAIPQDQDWAVLLCSENSNEEVLTPPAISALKDCYTETIPIITVNVTDVLDNPGSLLHFMELMCKAPIMIIDATGFQPGIMLLVGIRAVVRRGVTIVITTLPIQEDDLSKLPFNIQEIKLVSLNYKSFQHASLTSKERLKTAIRDGRNQSMVNPNYLDLPPYDAIRNPVIYDIPTLKDKILILCPFNQQYKENFLFIREHLSNLGSDTSNILRMLDISSPQLVGQSLYEHIRWTALCLVDWSCWLPNVFYELGVRLACSESGLLNVIDAKEESALEQLTDHPFPGQIRQLLRLFAPHAYEPGSNALPSGIKDHLRFISKQDQSVFSGADLTRVYPGQVYATAQKHFDWRQEHVTVPPHIQLRNQLEREFGKDRQAQGHYNVLYSANEGFKQGLQQKIREYWLCAWYYLLGRYDFKEFETDAAKREELSSIGEAAMLALDLAEYSSIKDKIMEVIDQLEAISINETEDSITSVRELKMKAKNRREMGRYGTAISMLGKAISSGQVCIKNGSVSGEEIPELNNHLADCYGIAGGIYRRWALAAGTPDKQEKLRLSMESYDHGYEYEQSGSKPNSYNMVNRLLGRILYQPELPDEPASIGNQKDQLREDLLKAEKDIQDQLMKDRKGDIWALADYGLVKLLLGEEEPAMAFSSFVGQSPDAFAYKSLLDTLHPLSELPGSRKERILAAIRFLEKYSPGS